MDSARSLQDTLRLRLLVLQGIERAFDLAQPGLGEVGVQSGGVETLMAEQRLHHAQVGAALDEIRTSGSRLS